MKKATRLEEIDNAIRFDIPLTPKHPFFVDFSKVRGEFEERQIYKKLNVNPKTFQYNADVNIGNKTLLFLGGMRGSGKTTEIAKYVSKLDNPDCFFCITCNIDQELDLNNMEYMDIVIFQLEKLITRVEKENIKTDAEFINSMQKWFYERIKEINTSIKYEGGFEISLDVKTPGFMSILKIAAKLKAAMKGSKENATKIRATLKNNFSDFADKFNEFIEDINEELRNKNIAQEILFIVDGLEKTLTSEIRRKIVLDELNRIKQIKVNTIFTLPIELMRERAKLTQDFSSIISFPFVKLVEKDGKTQKNDAFAAFEDFIYKRIDKKLFDDPTTVLKAIMFCGGSPRELLRIIEYANMYSDVDNGKITINDLDKALKKLAAETSMYITLEGMEKLKEIKENNEASRETLFDDVIQGLLEGLIVMEYNDGTYKRVNPIVELSEKYKQYVG